jgi:hypothetical protein
MRGDALYQVCELTLTEYLKDKWVKHGHFINERPMKEQHNAYLCWKHWRWMCKVNAWSTGAVACKTVSRLASTKSIALVRDMWMPAQKWKALTREGRSQLTMLKSGVGITLWPCSRKGRVYGARLFISNLAGTEASEILSPWNPNYVDPQMVRW